MKSFKEQADWLLRRIVYLKFMGTRDIVVTSHKIQTLIEAGEYFLYSSPLISDFNCRHCMDNMNHLDKLKAEIRESITKLKEAIK